MKIHEYQAKILFKKYGVPIPKGGVAFSPADAERLAEKIGTYPLMVKAQIHAGGRARGGGIWLARSATEVRKAAENILGMTLITHQTGPQGKKVSKILVEKRCGIERELYLSILSDRSSAQIMIVASSAGGMNIEEVAAQSPEKIIKVLINPLYGIQPYHCRNITFGLNLPSAVSRQISPLLFRLYDLFVQYDCSLVEVNPLAITADEKTIALDAKVDIDSNALFRHPDLADMRDTEEEDPLEAEAAKNNLNYIKLTGNVGNLVNGAGLAMATMDLIKQAGAEPANFLDVGGGASAEMVKNGMKIIMADSNVKALLINIFGGILRCDVLAEGVISAVKKTVRNIPVVVRMEGTNVEEGRRILAESGLNLKTAENLKDAAEKIVEIVTD